MNYDIGYPTIKLYEDEKTFSKLKLFYIMFSTITIFFSLLFVSSSLWSGIENFVPNHGSSELLFYLTNYIWYLSFAYGCYNIDYTLRSNESKENRDKDLLVEMVFCINSFLFIIYFLLLSEQKTKKAYHTSLSIMLISLWFLFIGYYVKCEKTMWLATLSFGLSIYNVIWSYDVNDIKVMSI